MPIMLRINEGNGIAQYELVSLSCATRTPEAIKNNHPLIIRILDRILGITTERIPTTMMAPMPCGRKATEVFKEP